MAKPLAFLAEVVSDIEEARDWYADRSHQAADRFLAALEETLHIVELHPQQGAYTDDRRLFRQTQLQRFPYVVVYRESRDCTLIVAVYHAARRPDGWADRLNE